MKNLPLYSIIFEDKTNFIGGTSYFDTHWMSIPNKKIKRIFYRLPNNDHICLSGYEKYYYMMEGTKDWMRIAKKGITILKNKPKVEYAYIMGRRGDNVISYRITLLNKKDDKYKMGDITLRIFNVNSKKIRGLNPDNWR